MLDPSFKRSPTAPVLTARSLPAKSTKDIRDTFSPVTPVALSVRVCVRTTENTACERDDSEFIFVAATVLDLLPSAIKLSISCHREIAHEFLCIYQCLYLDCSNLSKLDKYLLETMLQPIVISHQHMVPVHYVLSLLMTVY